MAAQLARPLSRYLRTEAGGAGLLVAATAVALLWANSPWSDSYFSLWSTDAAVAIGDASISMDLAHWVNDGLMALFFFVIGLEVRRELSIGELTRRRRIVVPVLGGLGGIVVPVALFLLVSPSGEALRGWGMVIGTDTAFLLGALAIVGPSHPTQLRIFLLSLTVCDDIVAVSVIGVVYSGSIDAIALLACAVCLLLLGLLSRRGAWRAAPYVMIGVALWVATFESGLHPSIAGMLAGLLVAARPPERGLVEEAALLFRAFRQSPMATVGSSARRGLQRAVSVNERLQAVLHPWVSYAIVPVFALANAGVDLRDGMLADALGSRLTWAIVIGLVAGKLIGISAGSLGAVRLRLGELPQGVARSQVVGGAALSGIGFTVSLLIAHLAFGSATLRDEAIVGVLLAAALSVLTGWVAFKLAAVLRGARSAGLPRVLQPGVDDALDHALGPAGAPLTLVEFADFECPFCGRATGVVHELRERFGDELRYVFRHLPLTDVHGYAELAARAAEAAAEQGSFWPMHNMLFAHQDELEVEDLVGYADELELDVERFLRDLDDERLADRIRAHVGSAELSGARGTPTFYVGGLRHTGPNDTETLAAALEASRARGGAGR